MILTSSNNPEKDARQLETALASVWAGKDSKVILEGQWVLTRPVRSPGQPNGAGVPLKLEGSGIWNQIEYHGPKGTACLTLDGVKWGHIHDLGIKFDKGTNALRISGGSTACSTIERCNFNAPEGVLPREVIGLHLGYGKTNDCNAWAVRDSSIISCVVSGWNNLNNLFSNASIQTLWFERADPSSWPSLDSSHNPGGSCSTVLNMCSSSPESLVVNGGFQLLVLGGRCEAIPELVGTLPKKPVIHKLWGNGKLTCTGLQIDGWGGSLKDWVVQDNPGIIWNGSPMVSTV